jgi:hypothetical protein
VEALNRLTEESEIGIRTTETGTEECEECRRGYAGTE